LGILKKFWQRLFARHGKKTTGSDDGSAADPETLEREISAIGQESRVLADEVHRFRTDAEHVQQEESRKLDELAGVYQRMEAARDADQHKLAELESLNSRLQAARDADDRKFQHLEKRLAELEGERKQAAERVEALELSQSETSEQLDRAGRRIEELQAGTAEQARQFRVSLSDTNSRLDDAGKHVSQLEVRLKSERQDFLDTIQLMLERNRRQDVRLNWTLLAAVFALLLGTAGGAVLVLDVQKNARVLAGMSDDIKVLMSTVNDRAGRQNLPQPASRSPAVSAAPPIPASPPMKARTAPGATTRSEPRVSGTDTASKLQGSNPALLGSTQNGGRITNRKGIKQYQRKEAVKFFEENARVDGVITVKSGLQYRVVKPGSGKSPTASDKVVINFVGTTLDGTVIDETYSDGVPKTVSMGEVLPAWRQVLQKMEEGAEFELYLSANQATRRTMRKRGITGFEPHMYFIELLQVVSNDDKDQKTTVN
jgi:hypothetical protein